ncbi:MAG: IS4 family transposase [Pirellulaceae bacterium]|nr:IS4 family transposase [Pirellulaceae bacterium]
MARKSARPTSSSLQGFKYFELLDKLLDRLSHVGCERDKAGNRKLHCDQYMALLLLYFFNPTLSSLRGLQQASELEKVEKLLGTKRTSLGSLSEAGSVFDPSLTGEIMRELAKQAIPLLPSADAGVLKNLTAVDGSFFNSIAHTSWALWSSQQPAAKLHLHFSVFDCVPRDAVVTPGKCSEAEVLRKSLEANRLYVLDRGYQEYSLYRGILDIGSSFIGRVKDNIAFKLLEEREITDEAGKAGVIKDMVVSRIGTDHHKDEIKQTLRIVVVSITNKEGKPTELWLVTNLLHLPAEIIGLGYRYRWTIELFFRWFKQILGARHLISTKENGITMQLYAGLIASLLIVLWTGLKANKRTWEMIQFYFMGWATLQELESHIAKQKLRQEKSAKKSK